MKRIIYIANARIPTEKAHGLAIMKMCEAFALQGAEVEFVVPKRSNPIKDDPFAYYDIERNFKVIKVPVLDLVSQLGKVGFFLEAVTYALSSAVYCLFKKADVFYGRDELALSLMSLGKKNIIWEAHTAKKKWLVKGLLKRSRSLVVISNGLKEYYKSLGVSEDKIFVAPSGVDIEKFSIQFSKEAARRVTGLPQDKKIALYTGHLYPWKGVNVLAEAASKLDPGVVTVFVGGTENDIASFKKNNKHVANIIVMGRKPYSEIPVFLKAADILVVPNSAKEEISRLHTSPMKLFEYMASERPIIASNLPSIHEVLNEENSFLVLPDSPDDLAAGIKSVFVDEQKARALSTKAFRDVQKYSWIRRAETILSLLYPR